MNVAYFSPDMAALLREHGVKIWEVTDWRCTCDLYMCNIDPDGLPVYAQINKRIIVKTLNQEEKTLYFREDAKREEIMRSTKKLAKMLYKHYRAMRDGGSPRWRELSREQQGHFIRAAKNAIRGL